MGKIEHTPLPWTKHLFSGKWQIKYTVIIDGKIVDDKYVCDVLIAHNPNSDETAEFIITACNAYYGLQQRNAALVSALANAADVIADAYPPSQMRGHRETVWNKARELVAANGGGDV